MFFVVGAPAFPKPRPAAEPAATKPKAGANWAKNQRREAIGTGGSKWWFWDSNRGNPQVRIARTLERLKREHPSLKARRDDGWNAKKNGVLGRDSVRTDFFPGEKEKLMVWVVGLGPVGLDSDWIPENERDCWPWG